MINDTQRALPNFIRNLLVGIRWRTIIQEYCLRSLSSATLSLSSLRNLPYLNMWIVSKISYIFFTAAEFYSHLFLFNSFSLKKKQTRKKENVINLGVQMRYECVLYLNVEFAWPTDRYMSSHIFSCYKFNPC